jgi:hypothetical protein
MPDLLLRTRNHRETAWPEDLMGAASTIRGEYLAAVKAADQGDYERLVALHRRFTPNIAGLI